MIFKDHRQWPDETNEADKKEWNLLVKKFTEFIGNKWPVAITWAPEKVSKTPGNRLEDKPGELPIRCQWTAKGPDGHRHIYTYAENYSPDPVTKTNTYTPKTISFPGFKTYTKEDDLEFLIWLWICYPPLKGGLNSNPNSKHEIMFYLPHIQMKKDVEYDTAYTEAMVLITDRKHGLPIGELRKLASSYFIPKVEEMEDWEVVAKMKARITEGTTPEKKLAGVKLFLDRNMNKEGIHNRYLIQKAIENKYIVFDVKKRLYHLMMDGRKVEPPLCIVKPDEEPTQVLFEVMSAEKKDELKMIERSLDFDEGKKVTNDKNGDSKG